MVDKELLKEVLDTAAANGCDFSDIFIENRQTTGIRCEAGKVEKIQTGVETGAGLRVICGDSTAYAYTNDLSRNGLMEAAKIVSHAAACGKNGVNLDFTRVKPLVDFVFKERPEDVPTEQKVELVEACDRAARREGGDLIKQVIVGYGDVTQRVVIANNAGDYVEDERIRTRLTIQAVAAEGPVIQTGVEAVGGLCGFELFAAYPPSRWQQLQPGGRCRC